MYQSGCMECMNGLIERAEQVVVDLFASVTMVVLFFLIVLDYVADELVLAGVIAIIVILCRG